MTIVTELLVIFLYKLEIVEMKAMPCAFSHVH
jgi:hypothetical protein